MYLKGITKNWCEFRGKVIKYKLSPKTLTIEIKELNKEPSTIDIDFSSCNFALVDYVGKNVIIEAKAYTDKNGNLKLKWQQLTCDQEAQD